MRGNAWGCMALRGKLLQVGFIDAQNPSEDLVGGLIRMFRVLALPALKFRPGLIACLAPNIFLRNPLARLAANLFDVSPYHRPPIRALVLCVLPRIRAFLSAGSFSLRD